MNKCLFYWLAQWIWFYVEVMGLSKNWKGRKIFYAFSLWYSLLKQYGKTAHRRQEAVKFGITVVYTAPKPPNRKQSKVPRPNPAELTPQTNPKIFGMFQRCIKWQKSWKMGEKMGKKLIFHWDFCRKILKFSQKFQILIGFSHKRARLAARFLTFF